MRITLHNFRTYVHSVYQFHEGEITLISGPSGIGKTTILEGIFWCLYGKRRGIYNHNAPNSKCYVLLEIHNQVIYRQGHPTMLRYFPNIDSHLRTINLLRPAVRKSDQLTSKQVLSVVTEASSLPVIKNYYEGDTAMSLIEQMFGTIGIWRASSYLEQNFRCHLLYENNNEKMNLLNYFSFSNDDPQAYIEILSDELKKVTNKFKTKNITYQAQESVLNQSLREKPLDPSWNQTIDQLNQRREELKTYQQQQIELVSNHEQNERNLGMMDSISKQKDLIDKQLISIQTQIQATQSDHNCAQVRSFIDEVKELIPVEIPILENESVNLAHQAMTQIKTNLDFQLQEKQRLRTEHQNNQNQLQGQIRSKTEQNYHMRSQLQVKQHELSSKIQHCNHEIQMIQATHAQAKSEWEKYDLELERYHNELSVKKSILLLNNLSDYIAPSESIPPEKIWTTQQQELEYNNNLVILARYGIQPVTTERIHQEVTSRQDQINQWNDWNSKTNISQQIKSLIDTIMAIDLPVDTEQITLKSLQDLQTERTNIHQGLDVLSCPHCQQALRYLNRGLVPAEAIPSTAQDLLSIDQKIKSYTQILDLKNKREQYLRQIETLLPSFGLNDISIPLTLDSVPLIQSYIVVQYTSSQIHTFIQQIQKEINEIGSVGLPGRIEPPSPSSSQLKLIHEYQLVKDKLDRVSTPISMRPDSDLAGPGANLAHGEVSTWTDQIKTTEREINMIYSNRKTQDELFQKSIQPINEQIRIQEEEFRRKSVEIDQLQSKYQESQNLIQSLEQHQRILISNQEALDKCDSDHQYISEQISKLSESLDDTIRARLDDTKHKVYETHKLIEGIEYHHQIDVKKTTLNHQYQEIVSLESEMAALIELKKSSIDIECYQLESTVETINNTMKGVLDYIFDDPISVYLRLHKELKTKKGVTKPKINIAIDYKGVTYDSFNGLSGGEADRVSYALTLALNLAAPSPFLILDESLSSLDEELRSRCLMVLRHLYHNPDQYKLDRDNSSEIIPGKPTNRTKIILCVNHEDVEGNYDSVINIKSARDSRGGGEEEPNRSQLVINPKSGIIRLPIRIK